MSEHEPSEGPDPGLIQRLHRLLQSKFLEGRPIDQTRTESLFGRVWQNVDAASRATFERIPADQRKTVPSEVLDHVRSVLGTHAHPASSDPENLKDYLAALTDEERQRVYDASLRQHFGVATDSDTELLSSIAPRANAIVSTTPEVSNQMPSPIYTIDLSSLPDGFDTNAFLAAVDQNITAMGIPDGQQLVLRDGIKGMLLLDGNSDSQAPTFGDQIRNRLWNYIQTTLVDGDGNPVLENGNKDTNQAAFIAVDGVIGTLRGAQGAFYQELATASRQVIDGQRGAIIAAANNGNTILLSSAVQSALQSYGSGGGGGGSFELPPLTGGSAGGGTDEIIPDHIRGVAMLYAAYQLDVLGMIKVVDRNVEIFMNGQLPVSNDLGGNALNAYYWDSVNRMSETARWMQYGRVLGAQGAEISKEVQPNTTFDDLFMRFLAGVSEFQRQQRLGDLLGNNRALSLTGEHVRKAGRDLAANCTLYGYGYTQFAAKKLQQHIQTALNILKLQDVQQAWGVNNAWQVVERVSSQEFKATPNVVKYRTMAESGKKILDLVAKNSGAWSTTSNNPLFPDPNSPDAPSDINNDDATALFRHTEYVLAVKGVQDQQVVQSSQPTDTSIAPSIPSLDGLATGSANADITGQIQKMLQQGQTPNADQLRQMVGV
jgi:hypothetical protein